MKKVILTATIALAFAISASAAENVKATVHADQAGAKINREIYGQFSEHLGSCIYGGLWVGENSQIPNINGYRKDVFEALKALKVPVLRWPGGCFADDYHWMDGIGPKDQRPSLRNNNWGGTIEDNSFGTHEFLNLCEMLGCEPYISGNVGSGTVKEMAQWVEYMTSDGDVLFNADDAVSPVAGDAGDGGNGDLVGGVFADHGARMIGLVGIADIGGDTGLTDGEHRVLMQDGGAHMAQLPELFIGDGGDLRRAVDDPGIRHQKTGYVGPVFIDVGVDRAGHEGAGDIAAAAGEGADLAVLIRAVETGHDGGLAVLQQGGELFLGLPVVEGAVVMEDDTVGGVHKLPAQVISHENGAEVFAPAGAPVPVLAFGDALFHFIQPGGDIHFQMEALGDGKITVPDAGERFGDRFAFGSEGVAGIEQVCHFIVVLEALSGRTGDEITAGGFQLQDAAHLAELFIIGQRAAAELRHNTFEHGETSRNNLSFTVHDPRGWTGGLTLQTNAYNTAEMPFVSIIFGR